MIEGTQTEFTITQTFVIRATTQAQAEEAVIKDDFSEVDVQEIKTETKNKNTTWISRNH